MIRAFYRPAATDAQKAAFINRRARDDAYMCVYAITGRRKNRHTRGP